MNKEIYLQLLTIAKEVFKYLKCTDKNRVLSAGDIARNLQARADGVKNKNTWAVYWGNTENLPNKYTVCTGSFKASFDFWAVFAYLAKFETLAGVPVKDRFSFVFGDGSERKEKARVLYYNKKQGRAIADTILIYMLNENIAIKPDGSRARVFVRVPGNWFEWYEVNFLDHYKKNYESNVLYLTGEYYNNIINVLRRWDPASSYIYNDICTRASEQIKANDAATDGSEPGTASTDSKPETATDDREPETATDDREPETTATAGSNQETTASTGADHRQTVTTTATAAKASTTASDSATATAGSNQEPPPPPALAAAQPTATPPQLEATATAGSNQEPPPPPPMARGAPYIYTLLWRFIKMELCKTARRLLNKKNNNRARPDAWKPSKK